MNFFIINTQAKITFFINLNNDKARIAITR
ncbi:Uncharacterised protein [Vibrio cholerae]|nr:Uncharacterised protein [Vibrio cholerae]